MRQESDFMLSHLLVALVALVLVQQTPPAPAPQ